MYTRRSVRLGIVVRFGWKILLASAVWAILVVLTHSYLMSNGIDCSLPIAPIGTIGVAVAFYVGFKNSQSYDRFWEARKIWGGIVNVSRAWSNQVISLVSSHNSWVFWTMEAIGDASEDPFDNFINDVPMTALCTTIEIDLRQMLGESEVPESLKPVYDILM